MKSFEEPILAQNAPTHENSICIDYFGTEEIKDGYTVKGGEQGNRVGIPIYLNEEKTVVYPISHSLIIGSTGSGKTSVFLNNASEYNSSLDPSVRPWLIYFDCKGELYRNHGDKLMKEGYEVLAFKGKDPFCSMSYNPCADIFDMYTESIELERMINDPEAQIVVEGRSYASRKHGNDKARVRVYKLRDRVNRRIEELAEILISNSDPKNLSWAEGARTCFRAIAHTMLEDSRKPELGMTKDKFTLSNLLRAAFHTDDNCEEIIEWLQRSDDIFVVSSALSGCYRLKATVTRDGYISSMNAELGKIASNSVGALTFKSCIDFKKLTSGEKDYAIFLIPDDRSPMTQKIMMIFLNDLLNTLCDTADEMPDGRLNKDVVVLADEFANFAKLPDISGKITTYRSRGIWLQMVIQSYFQLVEVYGKNVAQTISDNCDLTLYFGSNNYETKQSFSRSMGEKAYVKKSIHHGSGGPSVSEGTENGPVVHISDLDKLKLGEFYVKTRNCVNLKSRMTPYFMRTDIDHSRPRKKAVKYNGFDPNANIYNIAEVLKIEEELENEKRTKEREARHRNGRPHCGERDDNIWNNSISGYKSAIEMALPPLTFNSFMISKSTHIGVCIRKIMQKSRESDLLYNEKLEKLKAMEVFPAAIHQAVFSESTEDESEQFFINDDEKRWVSFFKREIMYDKSLMHAMGKEGVLDKLRLRKTALEESELFDSDILGAYEDVIRCIAEMEEVEYALFRSKATEEED